jgi:RNA polymerase primary sigma factor
VRKPADLPGHHHLARRAQRRQHLLRDIIDLEATYAGPEAKGAEGADPGRDRASQEGRPRKRKSAAAPQAARGSDDDVTNVGGEGQPEEDDEDDEDEVNLSLAAMEAELKPQVMETLDTIAETYKKLRKLQDQQSKPPG